MKKMALILFTLLCISGFLICLYYFTKPSTTVSSNQTDLKSLEARLLKTNQQYSELNQNFTALTKKYDDLKSRYDKLSNRVSDIEKYGDIALGQKVNLNINSINRLEDLINKELGITKIAGSITNLTKISDHTYVVLIEDADDKRKTNELQLSKTCVPFFYDDIINFVYS